MGRNPDQAWPSCDDQRFQVNDRGVDVPMIEEETEKRWFLV